MKLSAKYEGPDTNEVEVVKVTAQTEVGEVTVNLYVEGDGLLCVSVQTGPDRDDTGFKYYLDGVFMNEQVVA